MLKKETIKQAINQLPPREKQIIYLRFYSGLSQMEIGMRMNLSQMHISRILSKSIKLLRKVLDPSLFDVESSSL